MAQIEISDKVYEQVTAFKPVIIVTAKKLEEEERALLAKDALAILSKETQSREEAIPQIREALIAARR